MGPTLSPYENYGNEANDNEELERRFMGHHADIQTFLVFSL
jgi:hypothetical protein